MNQPSHVRSVIAAHPFVQGLSDRIVDALAEMADLVEMSAGSWIALQGKPAHAFHLVTEGRCAIEVATPHRAPLVIATVHPGDVLGWSWMFPPHRWHFDVLAIDTVRTIAIDGDALRNACATDHELGYEITRRLAGVVASRLEATRLQLLDVYGPPR